MVANFCVFPETSWIERWNEWNAFFNHHKISGKNGAILFTTPNYRITEEIIWILAKLVVSVVLILPLSCIT